jgi:hypothetical protein
MEKRLQIGPVREEQNKILCEEFILMAHKATKSENMHKARTYQIACEGIRLYPVVITSGIQAQKIKGVGPTCSRLIDKFLKDHGRDQATSDDPELGSGQDKRDAPSIPPSPVQGGAQSALGNSTGENGSKKNASIKRAAPDSGSGLAADDGQSGSDGEDSGAKRKKPRVSHETSLKQLIEAGHLKVGQELTFRKHDKTRGADVDEKGILSAEGHITFRYPFAFQSRHSNR